MKQLLLRLSLVFFLVSSSQGYAAPDDKERSIQFRITRFDPSDRASPTFMVGSGKRVEVTAPISHIEGPFRASLRDGIHLDFYDPDDETKPKMSTKIPATVKKDLLLVLVPGKEGYKIKQVRTPRAKFKGGDRFLTNFTRSKLGVKFGKKKAIPLAAGKSTILSNPRTNKDNLYPIDIQEQVDGNKWKLVTEETWSCDPRFRKYLFIYRSPRTKHIAFHAVSERLSE